MKSLVLRLIQREPGATAAEDGLIAPGFAIAITGAVNGVGTTTTTISSSLK
jgi:Flp pilus assembly pilin Flp